MILFYHINNLTGYSFAQLKTNHFDDEAQKNISEEAIDIEAHATETEQVYEIQPENLVLQYFNCVKWQFKA